MSSRVLRVGTRGSQLALEQARRVRAGLRGPSEIQVVRTGGDRFADQPLGEQNQVGFFTKEIEDELLAERIDLAVHSLKDLPTQLAPGLVFGALLAREEAADILLVRPEALAPDETLPLRRGARVGASSMRRQSLLRAHRPDLEPRPIRGNVPTRIDKAIRGEHDAIILSRAGLERLALGVGPLVAFEFNPRRWPGAPGQAVIAVEIRVDDAEARARLVDLDDAGTRVRVEAERSLLVAFGGGCHAPFGAYCELGPQGCVLHVAAPGVDDQIRVARFEAIELESARREAEVWVRSGRPERPLPEEGEWLCRPARSWC